MNADDPAADLAVTSAGTGPRLVWVDAALGSSAMRPLAAAVEALRERFEVITYDRRGRGDSPPASDPSPSGETDDLIAVVTAARPVAAVVGFSSGAALVLHAAHRLDVDRLILIEPAVDAAPDDSGLRERLQQLLAADDPDAAVRAFYDSTGVPDEIVADITASEAWPALVRSAPTLVVDTDLTYVPDTVIRGIDVPVEVIVSAGSPAEITDMSDGLAARAGARIWREPGGWHGVDPDALTSRIADLVGSTEA